MGTHAMLFKPLTIGPLHLKNRIGMAPMTSSYADDRGHPTEALIQYYVRRARGGVGLITVESCYVDRGGKGFLCQLALDEEGYITALSRLAGSVREAGAGVILQLIHCGRQTTSMLCGAQPVAPSPIPCPLLQEMPRELSGGEVEDLIGKFVVAAKRAKRAGFDGVEIHAAHGYLINQFLSAYSNRRSDRYGGSLENRSRMLLEIIKGIRKDVGRDYAVTCRLSAEEFVPGGLTLSETGAVAAWLEHEGVDAVSVSGGVYESGYRVIPPMDAGQGSLVYLAEGIKAVVGIPVFAVGGIYEPEFADRILVEGKADMVLLGRSLLADPDWPVKTERGEHDRIRPCVYCNHCRNRAVRPKMNCAVNYEAGREAELDSLAGPERPRKVVVVGGGVAGMEAAYVSAMRGHTVTLYERTGTLGGNLLLASVPPKRERLGQAVRFLEKELERLAVDIHLNTEVTLEQARSFRADVIFVATGTRAAMPDIPGIKGPNVHAATDVLRGEADVGRYVVVIGGGLVGLETADYLRERGKAVTIIEKLPEVAADPNVEPLFKRYLLSRLGKTGETVLILTGADVLEIGPDFVRIDLKGAEKRLPGVDAVVVAAGFTPAVPFDSKELGDTCEVHVVGDAVNPRTLFEAVHSAAEIAFSI
jgi:2,4-dienoyl-CoA reductase-like NADH-dependent reductase (Old Yellow Enzyme family)/thioredoxin reductase